MVGNLFYRPAVPATEDPPAPKIGPRPHELGFGRSVAVIWRAGVRKVSTRTLRDPLVRRSGRRSGARFAVCGALTEPLTLTTRCCQKDHAAPDLPDGCLT